jgi:tetratricopeptide (TPR) repeat protein
LWEALSDALKHPLEGARELVLVVDGLDELDGDTSSPQTVFEKLVHVTEQGRNVKLIALSQSLKVPSKHQGTEVVISTDEISDDIYAITLRSLTKNHTFRQLESLLQENILTRIVDAADGSFIWALLVCEVLHPETSKDAILAKVNDFEKNKPTIEQLTEKLLTILNPSNDARMILNWLLESERPLTFNELKTLFSIDLQNVLLSNRGTNIPELIKSIAPVLTVHEDIVRVRHHEVTLATRSLIAQNRFSVPIKDSETDLLLRTLAYAKIVLTENRDPTFNNLPSGQVNHLFSHHTFLEYVVRYWPRHLEQSRLSPKKPGDKFNISPELKKVIPNNALLPLLERLVWESDHATTPALNWHIMVGRLREQILTQNSTAVLQTYITIATYFNLLSRVTETAKYYWISVKIARTVLGETNDLVVDCCTRFLEITEAMTFNSRTEIVTYKEEILKVLITIYTKQYGATSEYVLTIQRLLVDLYTSIKEEENAKKILIIIREATVKHYGKHSNEARQVNDRLTVIVGHKETANIEQYDRDIFTHEEQDEDLEVFDIKQIEVLLRRAMEFQSTDIFKAEQTYIELWQQVSMRCSQTRSVEWHEKNIEIAQSYSKFLHSQKREVEMTSVLNSVWKQYEHHDLSFSQSIVQQLTVVAQTLKSVGHYAVALSIFQFASSYYKSVKKEDSSTFKQIEEEVVSTSTEVVKRSLNSSSSSTQTVSGSTFHSVFESMITNQTTAITSTTLSLAKKLTFQYVEEQKYSEAIKIVHLTLKRTWSSYFSESLQHITLTTTFLDESVELIETLAQCYLKMRQLDKVEDTYMRLFQAVLVSKRINEPLFERVLTLLISFFDKYGFPDKAINVYQEVLTVYRAVLGPSNKKTISVLYILGVRCRAHARNHPYWIEYYQQVVTALNKDAHLCHADAMEAIIIVGTYYWEDRRYAEAVSIYSVLWNTFIQKTKEYKQFTDITFVKVTYERYIQCLEETRADLEVLHQVASQYHETCKKVFGVSAEITVHSTLSLASISQRSTKYSEQAIQLYEEASKSSSSSSSTSITEIKETLSRLYRRRITTSMESSSASKETIERATSLYAEQYNESRSKYGYSSMSTLSSMRELSMLYQRQGKTETAITEIYKAASEITLHETSSEKLVESATYIAQTFQSIHQEERCRELIAELHVHIIAKHAQKSAHFSYDLTKVDRTALVFIATLEYQLQKEIRMTFSEIMSDLIAEAFFYDNFRKLVASNAALEKIIIAAAPLRAFLQRKNHKEMVKFLEKDVLDLFVRRDTAKLKLLSSESPRLFIIAVLDHLGQKKSASFIRSVILASNENVARLTRQKRFKEAYDVADMAFLFAKYQNGYTGPNAISHGFKLAVILCGRDGGERCPDASLRKQMLQLSNKIVKEILEICKQQDINFAKVHLHELNELAALLGEHEDYVTLEWLLSSLWNTRDAQKSWAPQVLLSLGQRLVCARFLANNPIKAIRLCEDIAYNMRRVHGSRHPAALETYDLLAQLYTSVGQQYQKSAATDKSAASISQQYFRKALNVYEDQLKMMVYEGTPEDDDDDELDSTAALLSQYGGSETGSMNNGIGGAAQSGLHGDFGGKGEESIDKGTFVRNHMHLLKLAYQRLGGWPSRSSREVEKLNAAAYGRFGENLKGVEGVEKWSAKGFGSGKAESNDGTFIMRGGFDFVPKGIAV